MANEVDVQIALAVRIKSSKSNATNVVAICVMVIALLFAVIAFRNTVVVSNINSYFWNQNTPLCSGMINI